MTIAVAIQSGVPLVIAQNVVYSLPVHANLIQSVDVIQTSIDNSTWTDATASTTGLATAALFIRCTTGNTTVSVKGVAGAAVSSGGGGGAPAGSGTELQIRASASTFGAITGSSYASNILTLGAGNEIKPELIYVTGSTASIGANSNQLFSGWPTKVLIDIPDGNGWNFIFTNASATNPLYYAGFNVYNDGRFNIGAGLDNESGFFIYPSDYANPAFAGTMEIFNTVIPGYNGTLDLGLTAHKWRDGNFSGTVTVPTVNATTGYKANGTDGITTTITTGSLVGKTITVTNGIITGFA